jgi:hypothetical protein
MSHWRNNSGSLERYVRREQTSKLSMLSLRVERMAKNINKGGCPLRVVSSDQGFHFYRATDCYIGVTCCSLEELAEAINEVCSDAILFHYERGDFQNWIRDVLGDVKLAQSIDEIKMCSRQLSAECCREELAERLRIRIFQLETKEVPPFFGGEEENSAR